MRPLELQVEGFTSFRDRQEVAFRDFDLFVITGPTGAGKTSVLDAIAFALYGAVPRIGKHGLSELVTHGSAEARVQLDFSVNGERYRLARRLPRNGAQTARLQRDEGGDWVDAVDVSGVTAVNRAVLGLVKLDFESFCKAVLLPQGEFAEFLKGDPAKRRETLVNLLGLHHFAQMREIANSRARDLRTRDEQTEKILAAQFDDATPEAVAEARAAAKDARELAKSLRELLTQARKVESERAAAATSKQRLEELAVAATDLRDELESGVEDCRQAQKDFEIANQEKQSKLAAVKSAETHLAKTQTTRDGVVRRVGAPTELAAAATVAEQLAGLQDRARKAREAVAVAANRESELKEETAKTKRAVAAAKKRTAAARKSSEQAGREHAELAKREEKLTQAVTAAHEEQAAVRQAEKNLKTGREQVRKAESAVELGRKRRDKRRGALDAARQKHAVVELAGALTAGDPCPVCERPLADAPAVDAHAHEHLEQAKADLEAAEEGLDSAAETKAAAESEVSKLESLIEDGRKRLKRSLGRHDDFDALSEAAKQATAAGATASSAADAAAAALRGAEDNARAAELAERETRTSFESHEENADLLAQALKQAEETLEAAVAHLRERFGGRIPADAARRIAADRAALTFAEEELNTAIQSAANARKELEQAQERLSSAERLVSKIDVSLGKSRERAEGLLRDVKQAAPRVLLRALPREMKARDSRSQTLATWCGAAVDLLETAADEADTAAREAADRLVALAQENDLGRPEAAGAMYVIEQAQEDASEKRVRADEAAKQVAERLKQRRKFEKELEENREQRSVLTVLASELRANRFVDFVINETLDLLAVRASEELLRVSARRYSLVTEGANFSVVDHTTADERRSVRTLSGGETFLASLALALALSKHVTELAGEGLGTRLEAVFIDEGFGSLDAETLDEVIDALERVREGDVLVGVISHVPELSERIRTGLEVRKDGNKSVVVQT